MLFFDLGNVLLFFDHRRAARQLAALAGVDPELVWQFAFACDLNDRCDGGQVSASEFCRLFREQFACQADDAAIRHAASDIFEINAPMIGILCRLKLAGHRLGLLSNTCDMHVEWLLDKHYVLIPDVFDVTVYSYCEKLMKPDAAIYHRAAELAGVAPQEIVYVDDIERNVLGARAAGFDAVQYTSAANYAAELRKRGIGVGY